MSPQGSEYCRWLRQVNDSLRGGGLAEDLASVLGKYSDNSQQQPSVRQVSYYNKPQNSNSDQKRARKLMAVLKECLNKQASDAEVASQVRAELEASAQHAPARARVNAHDRHARWGRGWDESWGSWDAWGS